MTQTLLIWFSVATIIIAIVITRIILSTIRYSHSHHHVFELGKERESIWLPGDPLMSEIEQDDMEDL